MEITSTPLLNYSDFQDYSTDVVSDAFGIDAALGKLLPAPDRISVFPSDEVLTSLFAKINHDAKVH